MVVYSCKKCGEPNYLIHHAFWNITDFDAKRERCGAINTITLERRDYSNSQMYSGSFTSDVLLYRPILLFRKDNDSP
jgi:hypothetical protein